MMRAWIMTMNTGKRKGMALMQTKPMKKTKTKTTVQKKTILLMGATMYGFSTASQIHENGCYFAIFQKGQSLAYYALGIAFQLKNAQRPTLIRQVYSFPFEKREMSGEVFKAWCHISVKFVPMVREGRKRINLSSIPT